MPQRIVIYAKPEDPEGFLKHYFGIHIKLAAKLPGIRRASAGLVTASRGITPEPYLAAVLDWPTAEAMASSTGSPESQALGADVPNLGNQAFASFLINDAPNP